MQADLGYITSFLSGLHIPQHKVPGEAELEDAECEDGETREERERRIRPGATSRAESRQELQQRLQEKLEHLKGSKRDGPSWYGNHNADCISLSIESVPFFYFVLQAAGEEAEEEAGRGGEEEKGKRGTEAEADDSGARCEQRKEVISYNACQVH